VHAHEGQLQQIVGVDPAAERTAKERVQAWRPPHEKKLERAQDACGVIEHELLVFQESASPP